MLFGEGLGGGEEDEQLCGSIADYGEAVMGVLGYCDCLHGVSPVRFAAKLGVHYAFQNDDQLIDVVVVGRGAGARVDDVVVEG